MSWSIHAGLVGIVFAAAAGAAQAEDGCEFQPPSPVLAPHAYPGQTMARQSGNRLTETARLPGGLRIEIRQSACADFVTTEFTLLVPGAQGRPASREGWIELARAAIAGLKMRRPLSEYSELNDFLGRAKRPGLDESSVGACRDGSKARPGECSWESQGGFRWSAQRSARGMRLSAMQYLSA